MVLFDGKIAVEKFLDGQAYRIEDESLNWERTDSRGAVEVVAAGRSTK